MSDTDGYDFILEEEPHVTAEEHSSSGRRTSDGKKIVDFDKNGQPIGAWAEKFKSFVGKIARARVNINIESWKQVPESLKLQMWKEIQDEYFVDDTMYKLTIKMMGKLHRDFRNRLRTDFFYKTRPVGQDSGEAYVKYKGILTQDVW
ncbi:unnamed protein product, partial [Cuscuta europaea]